MNWAPLKSRSWFPERAAVLLAGALALPAGASPIPAFDATALTGETVNSRRLIGQLTVLIVTPSRGAAEDTRLWVDALHKNLDPKGVLVRDVLAIDLPFFFSEQDALGRARDQIPQRYHDKTWLLNDPVLEHALRIPTNSHRAHVLVLNPEGEIVTRVAGDPTEARIKQVQAAVEQLQTSGAN